MWLPLKRCRHAIKVGVSSALCLMALVAMRHCARRSGLNYYHSALTVPRVVKVLRSEQRREAFEAKIQQDEARIVPGLGEGGHPVHKVGDVHYYHMMKKASEKMYAMNAFLSDRIPYDRTLTDHRHPLCSNMTYDEQLPSASVVMVFRAQPYSVVLRAMWSVLLNARRARPRARIGHPDQKVASPHVYLKELILVDDNSTLIELKGKLSYYVRTRLPPDLVKIIRLTGKNSKGTVSARLAGARAARGDVLVFMEAQCEVTRDWLLPLLQRIKERPHALVAPVTDAIEPSDFEYKAKDTNDLQVGGFTFSGLTTWIPVSEREAARRGPSVIAPTRSPILQTGPFAVGRRWFWKMGGFDDGMRGWGADNLEISFRMWMCGGTVEVVPCSRVGLVFVKYPSHRFGLKNDFVRSNSARVAEVWMDDYKHLFYLYWADLRSTRAEGNVYYRRVVRSRLVCRSFEWYLEHIYPEKFVPFRDSFEFVRFWNPQSKQCLDTLQMDAPISPLGLHPCHGNLTPSQFIMISHKGELRDEVNCADIQYSYTDGAAQRMEPEPTWRVVMMDCHYKASSAKWRFMSGRLEHVDTGMCLDARGAQPNAPGEARAARCTGSDAQKWQAEMLVTLTQKAQLNRQQLKSLERIRRGTARAVSERVAAPAQAQRDYVPIGEPYSTTSLF